MSLYTEFFFCGWHPLAARSVRDTVPEITPRTINEAGTNLVIQENVIQYSLEMNLPNSDPLPNSMTEIEETLCLAKFLNHQMSWKFLFLYPW